MNMFKFCLTSCRFTSDNLNMFKDPKPQTRSLATREAILSTALSLFRQNGLDNTTIREISKEADVALGAAYYYFASKEAILLAYYDQVQEQHHNRVQEALSGKDLPLEDRLKVAFHAKLDILQNDRNILGALFRYVGEPGHALSALGPATQRNRDQSIAVFTLALGDEKLPDDIRAAFPTLLWAAHMGMLLYFIHDGSPAQARTRKLVDGALGLVTLLLSLVRLPLFKPFRGRLTLLLRDAALVYETGRPVSSHEELS
jgi:AcrR family transcriptional regulator